MTIQGKLDHAAGRKAGGKKIDTWTFTHPELDKVEIDVCLVSDARSIRFSASSAAPLLSGQTWEHSDIEELRRIVHADIAQIAQDVCDSTWVEALAIETTSEAAHGQNRAITLKVSATPLHLDAAAPRGNDGSRRIMKDNRVFPLIERSIGEERPGDTIGGIRIETPKSLSVVEVTDETRASLAKIEATLEKFGQLLGRRLGPDQVHAGLPTPQDIAALMQRAAQDSEE